MYVNFQAETPSARRWGVEYACVELGGATSIVLTSAAEARALKDAAAEAERLLTPAPLPDVTASCECAHPNSLHGPVGCLRPDCGCATFRPRATASTPEPPRVVAGTLVTDRPAVTA